MEPPVERLTRRITNMGSGGSHRRSLVFPFRAEDFRTPR